MTSEKGPLGPPGVVREAALNETGGPAFIRGLLVVLAALAVPSPAVAHQACHSSRCNERVARYRCDNQHPKWCVERAILTYSLNPWQRHFMRVVPACESGWNALAVGGPNVGLFQFNTGTWAGTPYGKRSPFRAKWNSLGAAWMLRQGRSNEWSCQP